MITDEDIKFFRETLKDVKPLDRRYCGYIIKQKKKHDRHVIDNFPEKIVIELSDDGFRTVLPEEELFFSRHHVSKKIIKSLKSGEMPIRDILDLHSMTVSEAKKALQIFLTNVQKRKLRSVLIIHGKGQAIIKSALNTWLRNYLQTLAFCSAKPKDGGAGAIYLLL